MIRPWLQAFLIMVAATACHGGEPAERMAAEAGSQKGGTTGARVASAEATPPTAPRPRALPSDTLEVASSEPAVFPLGFGREPTAEEIARQDIDVRPDGTGLPPGSGTIEEGARVYQARCAACHGPEGEGTPAGWPLVGRNPGDAFDFHRSVEQEARRTIGNYWPYATTVFDYTRRAMPYDAPGSLTANEVYAVTAWLLWRNRIIGEEEVMDAQTLPEVLMPAHDRFIPDDRPRRSLDPTP